MYYLASNSVKSHFNCVYTGKLKQSCSALYQSGVTHSGVFRLDLDGPGPLSPVYVQCDMGVLAHTDATRRYGVTKVQHNLWPGTKVRARGMKDMKKVLKYR